MSDETEVLRMVGDALANLAKHNPEAIAEFFLGEEPPMAVAVRGVPGIFTLFYDPTAATHPGHAETLDRGVA